MFNLNQKSERESEKNQNSVCRDFLKTCYDLGIPLNLQMISEFQKPEDIQQSRYGGPFALGSGKLIAGPAKWGQSRGTIEHFLNLGNQLNDFVDAEFTYTEVYKRDSDLRAQREQGIFIQFLKKSGMTDLLQRYIEFPSNATELLWKLLKNALAVEPVDQNLPRFDYFNSPDGKLVENCKDSEYYLAVTLPDKKPERDAFAHVYYDQDNVPVLYQKTGPYHLSYSRMNATAINLVPIVVNGIIQLPGTLCGVSVNLPPDYCKDKQYRAYPVSVIEGLTPVRLTMYGVLPEEVPLAFGVQFKEAEEAFKNVQTRKKSNINALPTLSDFRLNAQAICNALVK